MTKHEINVLINVNKELFKAIKILSDLNHDFVFVNETTSYHTIIHSCWQILLTVSEEITQTVVREDKKCQ